MGPERRPPSGSSGGAEPPGSALGDDERTPVDDERTPVDDALAFDAPRSSRAIDVRSVASGQKVGDWLGSLDARSAARTAAVRDALAQHGVGVPESRAPSPRGEDDVTPVDDRLTSFDELADHDTDETDPPPAPER